MACKLTDKPSYLTWSPLDSLDISLRDKSLMTETSSKIIKYANKTVNLSADMMELSNSTQRLINVFEFNGLVERTLKIKKKNCHQRRALIY